jgi:hypothetical protein
MNRSFSKIRHIQESNLRLEKRMLSEQVNPPVTSGATSGVTQNKTYGSLSDYLTNVPNIKSRLSPNATHMIAGSYFSMFGSIRVDLTLIDITTGVNSAIYGIDSQGDDISKVLFDALNGLSTKITDPNIKISSNQFPLPPNVTINGVKSSLTKAN